MKKWKLAILIGLAIFIILFLLKTSFMKLWVDPYHEGENVNFWEWLRREFEELRHGER